MNRAPPPLSQLLLGPSLHCCRRNSRPTDRANAPGSRLRPSCESDSATRAVTRADYTVLQAFVHAHVKVENRGGAALRLGDAVRGVAFRTFGPARHRPLSNHLSTRYDNKVVRVRVCGSGGGCGACTCAGWRVACSGRSVRPRAPNVTRETTPPPPDFFLCICIWYYVVVFRFYPSMLKEFRLPPAGLPATNEHK